MERISKQARQGLNKLDLTGSLVAVEICRAVTFRDQAEPSLRLSDLTSYQEVVRTLKRHSLPGVTASARVLPPNPRGGHRRNTSGSH
jgi:hypothetical protein